MDQNRWSENDRPMDGTRWRDSEGGQKFPGEYPPAYGNRWRYNDGPIEGNRSRDNGGNRNLQANTTPVRRIGSHSCTYHRHRGKSQDYHHGWSGNGSKIQNVRSNNRHHHGDIANSITHDYGKSSNYC